MLAHPIGFYFLIRKVNFKNLFVVALSGFLLLPLFSLLQVIRYSDFDLSQLNETLLNAGVEDASITQLMLVPAGLYASTPIMNMDLNLLESDDFKFSPYYSVNF